MKRLLFLSLVGAAIYALLVYSHDALKDPKAEISSAGQTQNHSLGNHFSSWDNYLPTPAGKNSQSASSQRGVHAEQDAVGPTGDTHQFAASQAGRRDGSEAQAVSVEWAKVMLAAKTHAQASVSSPMVRSYSPDTNLQVVRREGSWVLVLDPTTQEQGWVLDEFLSSMGDAGLPQQAALDSTTEPPVTKAAAKSKTRSLASKRSRPAIRGSNRRGLRDVAGWDPWHIPRAGRIERRRGFQPFLFGRFAQGR
jgi:hypothetical protein